MGILVNIVIYASFVIAYHYHNMRNSQYLLGCLYRKIAAKIVRVNGLKEFIIFFRHHTFVFSPSLYDVHKETSTQTKMATFMLNIIKLIKFHSLMLILLEGLYIYIKNIIVFCKYSWVYQLNR